MSAPAGYRSVFAVPEFRWLWCAHVLSVAGDQLARVALTVLVFDRTASAGLAALTYALTYLPDLVGGTALAHLADRFDRRTVMVAADVVRAGLVAVMAVPGVPLVVQAGLLVVVQLAAAPFQAAKQAVLPDLLAGDRLTVGIGVVQLTYQGGLVLGFGAGAAVVAALGARGALLVDAATFVFSALLIGFGMSDHRPVSEPGQRVSITSGWRLVARDPRLRSLLAIACCSGFYVVPEGLAVPYAAQLGGGTAAVGWLLAANPLGTVAGLVLLKRLPPVRRSKYLGPLVVATSLVLLPTGWAPAVPVSALLWAVAGALSAHDMVTNALYVAAAPPSQRGQVVGVAIATLRASQGAAIVAAGLFAQLFAPSTVIAAAAFLGVLFGLGAALAWARVS